MASQAPLSYTQLISLAPLSLVKLTTKTDHHDHIHELNNEGTLNYQNKTKNSYIRAIWIEIVAPHNLLGTKEQFS